MKTPNDIKRPNPSTPSLGQTYRSRERLIHSSYAFLPHVETDEVTGVKTHTFIRDNENSHGTYKNPLRAAAKAERAARKAAKKAA